MSQLAPLYKDDLDGTVVEESAVKRGVVITIDGRKGKKPLDLRPEMYNALVELSDGDPSGVRAAFTPVKVRKVRSAEEMEAIRVAARAALNPDGSRMFTKVNESGRQTDAVYDWYENVFLPSQETPTKA
jgi:hypothetical protein